jgi:hypothetical protein
MKRTEKQINNIKNGCIYRDNSTIIQAQKRRHLKAKINKLILRAIMKEKNMDTCKDWINKVESIQSTIALELLIDEINYELEAKE